jgi:hypothetical protein
MRVGYTRPRAGAALRESGLRLSSASGVKCAEDLDVPACRHRSRYDEVADSMGVFRPDARARPRQAPLEQFWRDRLLPGILALDRDS